MKKLPPTLLLALALEVVSILTFGLHEMAGSPEHWSISYNLASTGMAVVTYVLGIAGFLELAGRASGRTATGLRVAAAGFGLGLGFMVFWHLIAFVQPHTSFDMIDLVQRWGWFAVNLLPVLGMAIAVWDRDRRAAVIAIVVLLVVDPLPPLARPMYGWLGDSWRALIGFENALRLVEVIVLFVLARLVADGAPAPAPVSAPDGFRMIASALWLRVISAMGAALLMLMTANSGGQASLVVLKLAMIGGLVLNAVSCAMLVRGALVASRGGITDLPRMPLVVAAAGGLWCVGVALAQLPYMYRLFYGEHDYSFGLDRAQDYVQALALVAPLVAAGAVAAVATAIAGFASRRGLEQLRTTAQGKGAGFVGLMLASIAIQAWLLPHAQSAGGAALLMIGAAVFAIWATVIMAQLCAATANSLHTEPALPTATLRA